MKPSITERNTRRNGQSDDDNVRYMINTNFLNNKPQIKKEKHDDDDDNVRYKFPTALPKIKPTEKKAKQKIKVNFWSNKQTVTRLNNAIKEKVNRRHTIAITEDTSANKPKTSTVKVKKRVSFLPSPLFSDNHIPMVTVPDDLTIQLNEEEANDLGEDLNQAFVNSRDNVADKTTKRKSLNSTTQTNPKQTKRLRSHEDTETRNHGTENELEFFSKYVVHKLRKMETNQRIYSENLINTVLMLGQLCKLSGKSKIGEA